MATTKFIEGYYAGYSVPANTNLYVTSTGYIGAGGVFANSTTTITNDGRIVAGPGGIASGVNFYRGGSVVNGSAAYTNALIQGHGSAIVMDGAGSVSNYATIRAVGDLYGGGTGIQLYAGGSVTNGTTRDTGATVSGVTGIRLSGRGSVTNYGTVDGLGAQSFGVALVSGGSVINGSATDRSAMIEGGGGVFIAGAAGTLRNAGAIMGSNSGFAASLATGGALANGSLVNSQALIEGGSGVYIHNATATNLGVISAVGDYGRGLEMSGYAAVLVNGAAGHSGALIQGFVGVYGASSSGGMVVTNFGVIAGSSGTALQFASAGDLLNVEAGCSFQGAVIGGGGSVDFLSGAGTFSNLAGGNVTASGSMAPTTFNDFDAVIVGPGATFVDAGPVTVTAGDVLSCGGALTIGGKGKNKVVNAGEIEVGGPSSALLIKGVLVNTGTLSSFVGGSMTVGGAVSGGGVVQLNGGTIAFASSFTENVTFEPSSYAALELGQSQGYTGTITGFSTVGDSLLDLDDIGFVSSGEATYAGNSTGGVLTVTDGTHTAHINLKGNYLSSTFVAASNGHGGVIIHDPSRPLASVPAALPPLAVQPFAAAMASFAVPAGGPVHAADPLAAPAPVLCRPRPLEV